MTRAVKTSGSSLPAEVTSFVGRRHELADAKRLLSDARLLTLIGPGGVGKTRLALRVAGDVRRAFPDGVYLVELADLTSPALLPHTVAAAIGLRDEATSWTPEALAERLAGKRILLVLDNCEHMVEACAVFAHGLLTSSPELQILATSREALRAPGEHTLPVPPLSVPDNGKSAPGELLHYEAVQLFVTRASARLPGFTLDDETREQVARLCHGLDGMPLAIELAADRVRALSLHQINDRLASRLRLLTGGDRGAPSRQQTLRASVDWSYDLCTDAEKTLWARLSVFTGGFELDAAEGICADDSLPSTSIVDLVSVLLDKSVLTREERGSRARYRMLETIREYGHERLAASGEVEEVRRRRRDWYGQLVADAYDEWIGPRQVEWLLRLRLEHANIRAALESSLDDADGAEVALRIASGLWLYWISRGLLSEGRHWLDEALSRDGEPSVRRAAAFRINAHLAMLQGDHEAAVRSLESDRGILGHLPDQTELAYLHLMSGVEALLSDRLAEAAQFAEDALAAFRDCGELIGEIHALIVVGLAAGLQGQTDQAMVSLQQDLAITEKHSESWFRSHVLNYLALLLWSQGEHRRATGLVRDALRLKGPLDDQLGLALCYELLAWIAASEGDRERAVTCLGIADTVWKTTGTELSVFAGMNVFHDRCEAELEGTLSARAFEALRQQGAALSPEQALSYALGKQKQSEAGATDAVDFSPLTRREWQIAEAVAEGLSNRQIATRFVIAQRTAEGHVEHILVKLGFNSRAQIAAWTAERQSQPSPASP